jgi:excisionase family DNA binding protein
MSEINLIITRQEDLKSLIIQCMEEHSKQKQVIENTPQEKPMSRTEIAEYLGVSKVTVTDWMKKGLPHRRMNGRVYFIREEVMDAMKTFKRSKKNKMDS